MMRFISFEKNGVSSWGRLDGDIIVDLSAIAPDLKSAIAMEQLGTDVDGPSVALSDVRLLPVILDPGKILCVGHNYEDHRVETARAKTDHPSIFTRFADTLVGAGAPLIRPKVSTSFDYEAELAIVIGKGGRAIAEADAMAHVAGFTCFNDASVRDWQWHTHQFIPGKNFPGTGALGPALVTSDQIDNLEAISVESYLNGTLMQRGTVDQMIFPIPVIVSYVSQFTQLCPGDVIATGTPGGVGAKRTPPVWLKPGDEIEVRVSGVGSLVNRVIEEV